MKNVIFYTFRLLMHKFQCNIITFIRVYWIEILKDYFDEKSLKDFKRLWRNVLTFKGF